MGAIVEQTEQFQVVLLLLIRLLANHTQVTVPNTTITTAPGQATACTPDLHCRLLDGPFKMYQR